MAFYRCPQCNWSADDLENLLVCPECSNSDLLVDSDRKVPDSKGDKNKKTEDERPEEKLPSPVHSD